MKVIEINWEDACSVGNAWCDRDNAEPYKCKTVGYLIKKDHKKIVVAQSHCLENNDVMNKMVIPRGCVLDIKELSL